MTVASQSSLAELLEGGSPHPQQDVGPQRIVVPEYAVKALLRQHGLDVPAGHAVQDVAQLAEAAAGLRAPLVLKAYGQGLIHKSDVGGVRLGLTHDTVAEAAADMAVGLRTAGITAEGFLVEEQQPGGVELIVGVLRDAAFGHVVMLGLGGVATELLDVNALRVAPLSRADAEDLVDGFPGAPLLNGARGTEAVDRGALVTFLLVLAGEDGLLSQLGSHLLEFECNPVVATADGVTALDARLVLAAEELPASAPRKQTDFSGLAAPRSIAVAGASTRGTGFGNRFLAAYKDAGWTDGLTAIHPSAETIDGVPAYPSISAVPGGVDYLLVAVPAAAAVDLMEQAAGEVPFIHVVSGGFREMGEAGAALEERLMKAVEGTSTRLLGPNCIGVYSPAGRQAFALGSPREPGTVSVVSQSGGLSGDVVAVGGSRGVRYSKVISVGNAIDVTPAELVDWLVDDPQTEVIGMYVEGVTDGHRLVEALRRASGRKPVVILPGGLSRQGAHAVSSHTGSMAGAPRVWRAVAEACEATLVDTLEDFLATLAYLQHLPDAATDGVLVTGLGGGASVLATDACDRAGVTLTPLTEEIRQRLRALGHGAGTSVANPVEIPVGPASPADLLGDTLEAIVRDQPFGDVLAHVNVAAYYSYGTAGLAPLIDTLTAVHARGLPVRLAVVARNLNVARPEDAARLAEFAAHTRLPLFRSFDEAATAIAAAQRFARRRAEGGRP
ncbi:acetate--CoA ligase family protein [Streptomyces sp. NPDC127172]|uniref:acetate--CoA ligase family protein n=1 Tax=Streptomyces sp. NPDC127172 TaxID=3345382 RepID=UPI003640D273